MTLAQQLAKLALPESRGFLHTKKKASLLFTSKEAENLEKDTVYDLGIVGLQQLEKFEPDFQKYNETLFSLSSKTLERSVETKEVNERLNKDIKSFLIRLSPFFILKPAHEALEWLIHRFHIHEYDVDDLMGCILPHHDSNWFSRVLSLINIKKPTNKWHWLLSIQTPGVPLARATLFTHLYSDIGFLTFILELSSKTVEEYKNKPTKKLQHFFSFYATSICGAIIYSQTVSEAWLAKLAPYISIGLKSPIPDYVTATYMIISALVYKVKLNNAVLSSFTKLLMSRMTDELLPNGVNCLVLICNTQSIKEFKNSSLKFFIQNPHLIDTLYDLSQKRDISSLLSVLINDLIKFGLSENLKGVSSISQIKFLYHLVTTISLNDKLSTLLIRTLLTEYLSGYKEQNIEKKVLNERTQPILTYIEKRYVKNFDEQLQSFSLEYGQKYPQVLKALVNLSLSSAKHQVFSSDGITLLLSLNHPSANTRCIGIKRFYQCILEGQRFDNDFIEESLLLRFQDDDLNVLKEILEMPYEIVKILNKEKLYQNLIRLLNDFSKSEERFSLNLKVISFLLKYSADEEDWGDNIARSILPYLFFNNNVLMFQREIITSSFSKNYIPFQLLVEDFSEEQVLESQSIFNKLAQQFLKLSVERCNRILHIFFHNSTENMLFIGLCLIKNMIFLENNLEKQLRLACVAVNLIQEILYSKPLQDSFSEKFSINASIPEEILSESTVFDILGHIGSVLKMPTKLAELTWWSFSNLDISCTNFLTFCLKLFDIVNKMALERYNKKNDLTEVLSVLKTLMVNKCNLVKFLSIMWTSHCSDESIVIFKTGRILQALSLHQAKVIFDNMDKKEITEIVHGKIPVISSLLIAISCPILAVRSAALSCFRSLMLQCENINGPFIQLVNVVDDRSEELSADPNHLQYCFEFLYDNVDKLSKIKSPKKMQHAKQTMLLVSLKSLLNVITTFEVPSSMSACLLGMMTRINGVVIMEELIPFAKKLLDKATTEKLSIAEIRLILLTVEKLTPDMTELFQKVENYQIFVQILRTSIMIPQNCEVPQIAALEQITKEFFSSLPRPDLQQKLLGLLLDLLTDCQDTGMINHIGKVIKKISLNADQVLKEFKTVEKPPKPSSIKTAKRAKRSLTSLITWDMESRSWKRIVLFLELLQNKKKITEIYLLIPELFGLLKQLLEHDKQDAVEYTMQLILTFIHNICLKLAAEELPDFKIHPDQFNVELVVQSIRISENPQTHRQALLLLATAAEMFPEHVLHNIMSIFIFMKNNILRQDDSYSFQVITKTVETIIPILIKSRQQSSSDTETEVDGMVVAVTGVFVDAFPYIPKHRQFALFSHLVTSLGDEHFLWIIEALLLNLAVKKITFQNEEDDKENESLHPAIEFAINLGSHFKPEVQILTLKKLMKYQLTLPEEKPETNKDQLKKNIESQETVFLEEGRKIFDVDLHSAKQLRHYKFITLSYIVLALNNPQLLTQIAKLPESENIKMQRVYKGFLEENLCYIYSIAATTERFSNHQTSRYWRTLLHKAYEVLDKVISLLPCDIFIEVILELMKNNMASVRRKAMELVNTKLEHQQEYFANNGAEDLLKLIKPLINVVNTQNFIEEELEINQQTALFSLKLLVRILAPDYSEELKPILQLSVQVFTIPNINHALAASALLCLAEFCSSLKIQAISQLPFFMPVLVSILSNQDELLSNDLLLLSAVTALHKIVEFLPSFLSPYLLNIIQKISILSCIEAEGGDTSRSQLHLRLKAIRHNLAVFVAPRILLPAIKDCYNNIFELDPKAISWLMGILEECLTSIPKDDLISSQSLLQTLFFSALDFRLHFDNKYSVVKINEIEDNVIKAVLAMVWRLSESHFRTFYFKLFDWASKTESPKIRILVFYRLTDSIADKLKSLFVLFAGIFFKNAASILNDNNSSKSVKFYYEGAQQLEKCSLLLQCVFSTLSKCFEYDNEGFMSQERFDIIMDPLVDQIENMIDEENFEHRISTYLVPCLAMLAACSSHSWKTLNYQVLQKTRSSAAKVRFAGLKVIEKILEKLGEDYSPLLPETIPFLAELMEDETSEVETLCQEVIEKMENILGESLQKYF